MELFDILSFNTQKEINIVLTNVYTGANVEVVTDVLEAGTYMIGYSFEVNFGTKDKPVNWQVTGTFGNNEDFSMSSPASDIGTKKNKTYAFPKEWAGGAITLGIQFKDEENSGDITVDFADVLIYKVS